jgi:hypothetical protein
MLFVWLALASPLASAQPAAGGPQPLPSPTPALASPADATTPAPTLGAPPTGTPALPAAAPAVAAPPPAGPQPEATSSTPGATTTEVQAVPPAARAIPPKEGSYEMMIRNLDEKVSDLKEKIFRSKARLVLLKETVLHGSIGGSKAILVHRNEMSSSFRLEQVLYSLDGAPIYQKIDQEGGLDEREEFEIFHGAIVPGNHNLSVYLVYRGHGYGLFSYLEGYAFKIRTSFAFTAEEGKVVRIKIVGYEKGGITTDLRERPAVRFDMEILKDDPVPAGTAEASAPKASQP